MPEHELNGEHDNATIQCLELGDSQDRWQVKLTNSEASGMLTIFHEPEESESMRAKNYVVWDWDGCSSLVKPDNTATDTLQEVLDIFADEYS